MDLPVGQRIQERWETTVDLPVGQRIQERRETTVDLPVGQKIQERWETTGALLFPTFLVSCAQHAKISHLYRIRAMY